MTVTARRLMLWSPRVLGILFALFLGLFALDVFESGSGPGEVLIALVIHLVPTFALLATIAAAWRREWIGGMVFVAFALFLAVFNVSRPAAIVLISGPLVVIGLLFTLAWRHRAELHAGA